MRIRLEGVYLAEDVAPEGFVQGNVHASYLHLHWAGMPQIAKRIVASCV